jgi:hypothetical protein
MRILPTAILPKNILTVLKRSAVQIRVSPLLTEAARSDPSAVLSKLQTSENGLRSSGTGGCGCWCTPASIRW